MGFDPKTVKFPYPLDTGSHYLHVKKDDGTVFDAEYPYVDTSRAFRIKQFFTRILLRIIVFPIARIRMGLRIEGRKNLKKHREELKYGAVSCCNHVHMWDYIAVMRAILPFRPNVLVWGPNVRGENGRMIRAVGGIPIPENSLRATASYVKAVGKLLDDGGWLHIYSEGAMWEYYRPIRPFKRGSAYMACRFNKPLVPLAFSYREPGWIRKKIFRQIAKLTISVGEPLYADQSLPKAEREEDLIRRSHAAVVKLAGLTPEENMYPPVYEDSRRIDYYATEYGIGYRGSW